MNDLCHDLRPNLNLILSRNLQALKIILKDILIVILITVTLFYNAGITYSVLYYSLGNDSFTEKYCVNKEKPVLQCQGKCELAKIAKATEKQSQDKNSVIEKEYIFFFQSVGNVEFIVNNPVSKGIATKCKLHNFTVSKVNFHPPKPHFSFS